MSETLALSTLYVDYGPQAEYPGWMENIIEPSVEHLPLPVASEVTSITLIYFPLTIII